MFLATCVLTLSWYAGPARKVRRLSKEQDVHSPPKGADQGENAKPAAMDTTADDDEENAPASVAKSLDFAAAAVATPAKAPLGDRTNVAEAAAPAPAAPAAFEKPIVLEAVKQSYSEASRCTMTIRF